MDRYFEDYKVGEIWQSRGYTFTESAIIDFALIYDPQPFHIDIGAAEKGPYTGLIASGFQTLAITFRLLWQERQFTASSMGSPGFEQLRWLKPVRPGGYDPGRGGDFGNPPFQPGRPRLRDPDLQNP